MRILGADQFDQYVLNMALIHLCDQESHVGQQLRQIYNTDADASTLNPWFIPHWFSIYVPHPDQEFEEITLEAGLTNGYNLEVKQIEHLNQVPYKLLRDTHFLVVLKQKGLNQDYQLAATGIFVRPLAALKLDIIDNIDQATYQPVLVKHPIIREYPAHWDEKLWKFLNQELDHEALPNLVRYVDRAYNQDYRPPSWSEIRSGTKGFVGV